MKSLIDIHTKVLSRNREQNIFTIIISLLKLFTFSSNYYKTERKRVSTIIIHYFACVKILLVMWNRQTDKHRWMMMQRERDRGRISRGKCEHCCVISPLCRCVGIVCSPKSVLKSPPFISSPYTKHTYTHTLLHASPLSRCLSIFTFSGIQEDISWKK